MTNRFMTSIWIDANVPMYAFGRDHHLKAPCRRILDLAAQRLGALRTDAEVLQELLHRYVALHIWERQRALFEAFASLMRGLTEPVYASDVEQAAYFVERYSRLTARDAIHLAVMHRVGSNHIVTADRDFDRIDGVTRLDPLRVDEWRSLVSGI